MKQVTIVASSTDPDFVRVIVNDVRAFVLASHLDMVQTRAEVQTIYGVNYRAFEHLCWRLGVTVADGRSW